MADALLEVDGLRKSYRGRPVVNEVAMRINAGEVVGLLGPNGAGKTTTFYMIMGQIRPDAGTVHFGGHDVTHLPMYRRARMGMGYLAQEPSIFRKLTVADNVMAILETLNLSVTERRQRLNHLLNTLGIAELAHQPAMTLSGGERRRLEISRALVTSPSFLMLDEPFSGVDPLAVQDVQKIISQLRETGLGILITDHSVRETLEIVDRAYIMEQGTIFREGTSDFLVNDEKVKQVYIGDMKV